MQSVVSKDKRLGGKHNGHCSSQFFPLTLTQPYDSFGPFQRLLGKASQCLLLSNFGSRRKTNPTVGYDTHGWSVMGPIRERALVVNLRHVYRDPAFAPASAQHIGTHGTSVVSYLWTIPTPPRQSVALSASQQFWQPQKSKPYQRRGWQHLFAISLKTRVYSCLVVSASKRRMPL